MYAKKQHHCCECHQKIKIGEEYKYTVGKWDGEFLTFKTCEKCSNLFESLVDFGCPTYGDMYDAYWEYLSTIFDSTTQISAQYLKVRNKGLR